MKVFISWSGSTSREVGDSLRDWLPNVIQSIRPYLSAEDIDKGARWNSEIAKELDDSEYGILCVTPENLEAPWLNFEAGALSKSFDTSRVAPFLFGVSRTEVKGPLVQFQSTSFDRQEVLKLVRSLNKASGDNSLEPSRLDSVFEVWWPRLEEQLARLMESLQKHQGVSGPKERRETGDVLGEILEVVRSQQRVLNDPEALLPPAYLEFALRNRNLRGHPVLQDLRETWRRVGRLLDQVSEHPDYQRALLAAVDDLRRPIEYLLEEFGPSRRRRRGSSQIPDDQDQ